MANDKTKIARTIAKVGAAAATGNLPSLAYELVGNTFIDGISARNRRKADKWSEQLADELGFALDTDANEEIHRLLEELKNYPEAEAELYETIEDMLNARSQDIAPRIYALVSAKILSERKVLDSAHRVILESVGEFTDKQLIDLHKYIEKWQRYSPDHDVSTDAWKAYYLDVDDPSDQLRKARSKSYVDWSAVYGAWIRKAQNYGLIDVHFEPSFWGEEPASDGHAPPTSKQMRVLISKAARLLSRYVSLVTP